MISETVRWQHSKLFKGPEKCKGPRAPSSCEKGDDCL